MLPTADAVIEEAKEHSYLILAQAKVIGDFSGPSSRARPQILPPAYPEYRLCALPGVSAIVVLV
jgi:hypothetical protein